MSKNRINLVNAENPVRLGFYIPGCGVVTKTREEKITNPADMVQKAIAENKRREQNKK